MKKIVVLLSLIALNSLSMNTGPEPKEPEFTYVYNCSQEDKIVNNSIISFTAACYNHKHNNSDVFAINNYTNQLAELNTTSEIKTEPTDPFIYTFKCSQGHEVIGNNLGAFTAQCDTHKHNYDDSSAMRNYLTQFANIETEQNAQFAYIFKCSQEHEIVSNNLVAFTKECYKHHHNDNDLFVIGNHVAGIAAIDTTSNQKTSIEVKKEEPILEHHYNTEPTHPDQNLLSTTLHDQSTLAHNAAISSAAHSITTLLNPSLNNQQSEQPQPEKPITTSSATTP